MSLWKIGVSILLATGLIMSLLMVAVMMVSSLTEIIEKMVDENEHISVRIISALFFFGWCAIVVSIILIIISLFKGDFIT